MFKNYVVLLLENNLYAIKSQCDINLSLLDKSML